MKNSKTSLDDYLIFLINVPQPTMCCSTKNPHQARRFLRPHFKACLEVRPVLVILGLWEYSRSSLILPEVVLNHFSGSAHTQVVTTFGSSGVLPEALYHLCGLKTYLENFCLKG